MTRAQRQKLESLGNFVWTVHRAPVPLAPRTSWWDLRYGELVEYRKRHGHTKVPQHWPENKGLGKWVAKMRCQYNYMQNGERHQLTEERIEKLQTLQFDWGKRRPAGRARFQRQRDNSNTVKDSGNENSSDAASQSRVFNPKPR